MEKIWQYIFSSQQLGVSPEDHPVLLTDGSLGPKANREKMTELMFEKYSAPSLYIAIPAILSLLSTNRTGGIVVEAGEGVTRVVPVQEGCWLPHAARRMNVGGQDVTDYLLHALQNTYKNHNNNNNFFCNLGTGSVVKFPSILWKCQARQLVADIKETLAYVSQDYEQQIAAVTTTTATTATTATSVPTQPETHSVYKLPDGHTVNVSAVSRFQCAECMFRPSVLLGMESEVGVHQHTHDSVMRCDVGIRDELWGNVVLSGGTTLLPGFAARFEKELRALAAPQAPIQVHAPDTRGYGAWLGGSVLASVLPLNSWASKQEYEELGPAVVHRKCF